MIQRVEIACAELVTLEGIGPDDYVWATKPGGGRVQRNSPMSQTSFAGGPKYPKWWERSLTAAGVDYRNPHMARHSFATRLRQLGVPMEEIQRHLGHASISTTSDTYVHAGTEMLGDNLRRAVGDLA